MGMEHLRIRARKANVRNWLASRLCLDLLNDELRATMENERSREEES